MIFGNSQWMKTFSSRREVSIRVRLYGIKLAGNMNSSSATPNSPTAAFRDSPGADLNFPTKEDQTRQATQITSMKFVTETNSAKVFSREVEMLINLCLIERKKAINEISVNKPDKKTKMHARPVLSRAPARRPGWSDPLMR